jgi:pimeloyl-ACP methyl ester carboxylesterase
MPSRYAQWMYDWETRLTSVDNNRVIRPLDWGVDWTRHWPGRNGGPSSQSPADLLQYFKSFNDRIIANSDDFYNYAKPTDFRLERREVQVFSTREVPDPKLEAKVQGTHADFLRFTSPVRTPYPENDLANARWFPATQKSKGEKNRRAVVLLPHWNADALAYNSLCRALNWMGISVLRLSLPHHDIRRPKEIHRADYAVSANIGRTMDAMRQGVIDVRCCLDWLEAQGYNKFGIVGTSLGSCYAFIATAHDRRISVAAFNHASTYVADVVWHGQSTRHVREGLEPAIQLDDLRQVWRAVSPMVYFDKFSRWPRKSLIVYARYDLTFLPELSEAVVDEFARHRLNHKVVVLPCGHYTMGETPFKYMDGYQLANFLVTAF